MHAMLRTRTSIGSSYELSPFPVLKVFLTDVHEARAPPRFCWNHVCTSHDIRVQLPSRLLDIIVQQALIALATRMRIAHYSGPRAFKGLCDCDSRVWIVSKRIKDSHLTTCDFR